MSLLLAAALASSVSLSFAQERQLLTGRLDTLRRVLPDGPQPAADEATVSDLVRAAGLSGIQVKARPPLETGTRGDVIVDVTGSASFLDVDRLVRQIALSPRLLDMERLSLTGATRGMVQFSAVIRLPYWPPRNPLPKPPELSKALLYDVPRDQAEALLRDEALALAKVEAIAALSRSRRNPRLFLAELSAVLADRPAAVSEAVVGDDFVIRGLALGEGTMRGLEHRLGRGFFRVSDVLMVRRGACQQFEVHGRAPVVGPEATIPLPVEDPFRHEDDPCRTDRDPASRQVVRGNPPAKGATAGPLSVRTRGVDFADVFQVLAAVTPAGFVVDGDVTGRLDVELTRVTLADALAALQRAGVRFSAAGPLTRVSRAEMKKAAKEAPAPRPDAASAADPGELRARLQLKRARLPEVVGALGVLAAAEPTEPALRRVSVFTGGAPLVALRDGLLQVAGLPLPAPPPPLAPVVASPAPVDDAGPEAAAPGGDAPPPAEAVPPAPSPVPTAPPPPRDRVRQLRADELAVSEFELAALAGLDGQWVAFAYGPSGTLNAYRTGDRLADGVVLSVESTDVVLDTDNGPVRVMLPALSSGK